MAIEVKLLAGLQLAAEIFGAACSTTYVSTTIIGLEVARTEVEHFTRGRREDDAGIATEIETDMRRLASLAITPKRHISLPRLLGSGKEIGAVLVSCLPSIATDMDKSSSGSSVWRSRKFRTRTADPAFVRKLSTSFEEGRECCTARARTDEWQSGAVCCGNNAVNR